MQHAVRPDEAWARERFAAARSARLATVTPAGGPRIVPIVFALVGDLILTAVDHKPKSTARLARLADIAAEPRVSVLVDEYTEDWSQLWWARADGRARVLDRDSVDAPDLRPLIARYPQYADHPPPGPVILVDVERWSAWSGRSA